MKIIIDIPEEDYKRITKYQNVNGYGNMLTNSIINGTPLDEYMVKAEKENFIQTCKVFRERIDEV